MKRRNTGHFIFCIVLLIFVIIFSVSGTVMSRSGMGEAERERLYREKEKEVVRGTRLFLEENGYCNSGIALTRVTDEESRIYTMTIHHGRIDRLSQEERGELKRLLRQNVPEDLENLEYEFLIQ
ncbi:MAG: hypothetical protein NC081_12245 [Roseburia sp.]|nr:hypothetical protein [Roseburia sp.]